MAGTAGLAAVAAGRPLVGPALGKAGDGRWVAVAKLGDLREGVPHRAKVIADDVDGYNVAKAVPLGVVWLVRKGDAVSALSAICPHLGCQVDLADDGDGFHCPCHDSSFGVSGDRAPGKQNVALRGMDPLDARVSGAEKVVEVKWQRFALGTSGREAIG